MRLIDMTCPHCSAKLKVDADMKMASCEFCGASILIDDGATHVRYDNAEEAGYKFERGRQRAQAEMMNNQWSGNGPNMPYNANYVAPPKRRTWLWVLGWLFFFPIPLTVLISRQKNWPPIVRYVLIAALWIALFVIGATGESSGA